MNQPVSEVLLQPWSGEDLPLLEKLLGDPEMMTHLGGPETPEQILRRHQRYLNLPEDGTNHMFRIVWGSAREGVGNVGYWRKTWRDQAVYEIGWLILPGYQGHGIATKAGAAVIAHARRAPNTSSCMPFPRLRTLLPTPFAASLVLSWSRNARSSIRPGAR